MGMGNFKGRKGWPIVKYNHMELREEEEAERLHAKFPLNVLIVLASGSQNPQFSANLDIWGILCRPPFTDEGQI